MRRNKISEFIVPVELKCAIDKIGFSTVQVRYVYNLIRLMLKDIDEDDFTVSYLPFPTKYWTKVFGSRYNEFLNPLKSAGIIEVQSRFSAGREIESYEAGKFCKRMRINPTYYSQNLVAVKYYETTPIKNFLIVNNRKFSKTIVQSDIEQLVINKERLTQATSDYVTGISENSFTIDDNITDSGFEIEGMQPFHFKLSSALKLAQRRNLNLIKDGKKYILESIEKYTAEKKIKISLSYTNCINRLHNGEYYCSRNATNNRLDHNLTSLGKSLLNVIKVDNDLVEIDLKNSQFAILSHLIKTDSSFKATDDFEIFREQTANGTLYEFIQQKFGFDERDIAKTCMMELTFSSHRNRTSLKKKLRQLFPSVVSYVDNFKRDAVTQFGKDQHNQFAIRLQKEESSIFIDNLYYELKKQGAWVITKHDSFLVKSADAFGVRDFIETHFKKIGFDCSLK